MKRLFIYIISIVFAIATGCSDDANVVSPTTDGLGGGNGGGTGGGNVTFTIGNQVLQEGYDFDGDGQADDSFYLTGSPSVSVKIISVKIEIPGNPNFDTVQGSENQTFAPNEPVQINTTPYYNVGTGQKFTLKISGKYASDDKAFNVTTEYIVP